MKVAVAEEPFEDTWLVCGPWSVAEHRCLEPLSAPWISIHRARKEDCWLLPLKSDTSWTLQIAFFGKVSVHIILKYKK